MSISIVCFTVCCCF